MPGPAKTRAWLSLGGNIGEPELAIRRSLRLIDADRLTRVMRVSALFRTPPWGKLDQPDFYNAVAEVETLRSPRALLDLCLGIELTLKRTRSERFGPRTIDIDLLLYDERSVKEEGLEVPHPRMFVRAFVLVPLAEIAPDLMVRNTRVSSYLAGLDAEGIVKVSTDPDWWKA